MGKKLKILALRIDDELLKKLKDNATKEKRSLSNYIYIKLEVLAHETKTV